MNHALARLHKSTVTLGGQARTVLAAGDINGTTPTIQQVVIDMPGTLLAGNHKLKLSNTQGDSEVFIPLSEIALHDGSTWTQATASAAWSDRGHHTSLVYDNKMWVIGGVGSGSRYNDVYSSTDGITWRQVTASAAWSPRSSHASLVYNNKMWVMGGVL
jgi:hypothetical protein